MIQLVYFGEKIKTLRIERNLTQKQLALQLGVVTSAISSYESGSRNPSYDVLIGIAKIFHVSTDYLLGIEKSRCIDVTGLKEEDIEIIVRMVDALRK